ncbi:hypothetical protein SEA_LABELLE_51 [Mycobacterium phage Labelle]|nr:hypothetical protein SEA_LABELLE_51 [Mycobacterium phage Labelle]
MKIKIYLNDGEDHFFGFHNKFANRPELTMVHSLETTDDFDGVLTEEKIFEILAWVFYEFNIGESQHAKAYRAKLLRSLSVGDVVVVGETAWACESIGWKRLTTDELQAAIIWDDETESVR